MTCSHNPALLLDYLDGELAAESEASLLRHLAECPACRRRLAALREVDTSLAGLGCTPPSTAVALRVQRRIGQDCDMAERHEILTLQEAADFLRLAPDDLGAVLDELPWFELAGQIRFRRQALLDWVRRREQQCARERLARNLQHELRTSA